MPAGVVNGSSFQGERRARAIAALTEGLSIARVARMFKADRATVTALANVEFETIQQRKARLAAQWEQVAHKAVDQLNDHLDRSILEPNQLVPVAGVATDKILALRGDAGFTIKHEHSVRLADDDLLGFALARSKHAKARTVEPLELQDRNDDKSVISNNDKTVMLSPGANTHENGTKARAKRSKRPRKATGPV